MNEVRRRYAVRYSKPALERIDTANRPLQELGLTSRITKKQLEMASQHLKPENHQRRLFFFPAGGFGFE